jgi:hypothetical protein
VTNLKHYVFRTDAFRIHVGEIGDIRSIRIRQDNSKDNPSWFLASVSCKDNVLRDLILSV